MNKVLLAFITTVIFCNLSMAQDDSQAKLHLGIKAGTNYANVYDSQGEEFNADGKFGWVAGGFLSIPISSVIGVQPEVLFSQKGFKATGRLLGSSYELTRTTDYIDVPLYLSIKPISVLTIVVGPQFSFLTKQKDVLTTSGSSVQQTQEFKNDNIRKNILGISSGIDLNLSQLVLSARAGWDLYNNNGDGTSTTPRYKNAWVQATLGFRLF